MKTINGGSAVPGGYYLSKSNWEIFPSRATASGCPASLRSTT